MNTTDNDKNKSYLDWALKGRSNWWLYLLGIIILEFFYYVVDGIWGLIPHFLFKGDSPLSSNLSATLSFLPWFLAVFLVTALLHKRPFWSVAFPAKKLDGWNVGVGFLGAWAFLLLAFLIYALFFGVKLSFQVPDMGLFLPMVFIGLLGILLQTSTEELNYRGYWMQAARSLTSNPLLLIAVSALAFGLPHYPNLAKLHMPPYAVLMYIIDGAFLAWLAYRTGSLWMSMGWHLANNYGLAVLISVANSGDIIKGISLITADRFPEAWAIILVKIILYVMIGFGLATIMRRREKTAGAQSGSV